MLRDAEQGKPTNNSSSRKPFSVTSFLANESIHRLDNDPLSFQVVQQLLRHGADLHSLDKTASKPLDFRKYFGERRDDIMQAVQDTLQYK